MIELKESIAKTTNDIERFWQDQVERLTASRSEIYTQNSELHAKTTEMQAEIQAHENESELMVERFAEKAPRRRSWPTTCCRSWSRTRWTSRPSRR